jgi:hypothetical protein
VAFSFLFCEYFQGITNILPNGVTLAKSGLEITPANDYISDMMHMFIDKCSTWTLFCNYIVLDITSGYRFSKFNSPVHYCCFFLKH